MELLLQRALVFTQTGQRAQFLNQLKSLPNVCAVVISCVDPRVSPTKFLCSQPGQMFTIRNAGNFVPCGEPPSESSCTVLGTLDLACIRGKVRELIVCGHSDCKAMHLLNSIGPSLVRGELLVSQMSPIEKWVAINGLASYRKHTLTSDVLHFPVVDPQVRKSNFNLKLSCLKDFEECDRLSQVNVVQQMTNFYRQPLLAERLHNGSLNVHGLWFHIQSGQLHMFSRDRQSFVPVTSDTLPDLVKELDSP